MNKIQQLAANAKAASTETAALSNVQKNKILVAMAEALLQHEDTILAANNKDVEAGKKSGLTNALVDRLTLTPARIKGMSEAIMDVARFQDPIGEVLEGWTADSGIAINKVRVPIGVLLMIYEARPNVTADAAALALKSGNAIILKGGKEAVHSNRALADVLITAGSQSDMPANAIQLFVPDAGEELIELMKQTDTIDAIIPRGGSGLKRFIKEHAKVPVILTGEGLCHAYVDSAADPEKALPIVLNAKTHRPSVCNAIETLLLHKDYPLEHRMALLDGLVKAGVEIVACEATRAYYPAAAAASAEDWDTEYLDLKISVKTVDSCEEALQHIAHHSSGHSECIISENYSTCETFLNRVDAAAVYANASTRFSDGGVFGFGGEIGISTQKLHARGPMGVRELTTCKYVIRGTGQIRT